MATARERVDELFGEGGRARRDLVTPEGVPLAVRIAGPGDRAVACGIDLALLLAAVIVLVVVAGMFRLDGELGASLVALVAFVIRHCYFLHFELAWQGRTPGKKYCGLRVINRSGGELTASAVIARNLMREVEFFLPLTLLFTLDSGAGRAAQLSLAGWAFLVASLPLWNREGLRAGDIIAGTQVVNVPKRDLERDLATSATVSAGQTYIFTTDMLKKYGAFELQVLEEILRQPPTRDRELLLRDVCNRITRKIGWLEPVPTAALDRFLQDFYTAERAELEREKLFGRMREDKHSSAEKR